ncbi:MAG: right-handed parallel beta-helix repeat-containing protein, partial [Planctomycetaceae bacterium]|nr:right-handed parallel beta-helix repeat-containing protein [Planctomycetaceae bacterium]
MLKHSLLQLFRRHFTQRTANPCRKRLRHMDQKLDHLEDRTLLASFIVNSEASDGGDPQGGVITLRGAIDLANGNPGLDQITFSPSVIRIADGFSSVITDAVDIDGAGKVTIPSGFLNHGVLSVEGHTGTSIRNLIFEQRPGRGSIVLEGGGSHTVTGNRFEPLSGGFGTRVGVEILSSDGNQIGGNSAGDRNVFVGLGIGVRITEDTSAKTTSEGNFITGNLIGVKADGTVQANSLGIELGNSKATTIEANVISGNGTPIVIQDVAIETKVTNNRIGLAAASETAVPNFNPVTIAGNNSVVSGNVISGNFASGILISGNGNKLTGNKIGTNSDGSAAIPNEVGVEIIGKAATNEVGPGNVIVANASSAAVEISVEPTDSFLDGNSVEGNTIGLNSGQTAKLGGRHGILVRRGTGTVIIENVIGGLSGNGIVLLGQTNFSGEGFVVTDTFITDNTIGLVSPDGPILGNLEHGILIGSNVDRTTIGSTEIQPGDFSNDISFSGKSGIRIEENKQDDGTIAAPGRHAVNGNLIFDNGGLPIDTGVPGVNPQDVPDSDGFLNQPVIRSIREGSTIVQGELNVASGKYVLEFFDALGGFLHRESLTIVDPIADRTFSVTIPGNFEEDVSATLTRLDADLNGTTSESADIRLLPVDLKIKGTYESDNNFGGVDRGETIPSGDQINVISLPVGSIHQYTVEVVNRDDEARVIQLNAQVDDVEGWIPQFFVNLSPITSQITGAGFKTALLQPGESQIVIVEIESQNTSENGLPVIDEGDLFNVTIEAKVDGATPFETVDAVQAVARAGLFVNSSLDAPDADLDDGVPDADPNMKGQQLTLRSAIQFANTIGADPNSNARLVVGFELAPNDGVITILSKTHGPLPIITSNLSIDGTELIQPGPSEVKIFGQEMNENEHGL